MKPIVELKGDKNTLTESLEQLENKLFREYNRILMFGTDEEKEEHLNWDEMDDTEKKAFANMVGKEIVLQMTQRWL